MGMGACALVVESEDAVRERGMRGIVELLSSETSNSAFHGTRLDVEHIAQVMDRLVGAAERRFGIDRRAIAAQTVFVSHETYTPARGGSASAEVAALRRTFGAAAGEIVIANTKGFTGHPMGVGIEDVIAVKILEYGIVPPVPNLKEIDPELGRAEPQPRRALPGAVRHSPGRRLRLADRHDADAAHPRRARSDRQPATLRALAGRCQRLRPGRNRGRQARAARASTGCAYSPAAAKYLAIWHRADPARERTRRRCEQRVSPRGASDADYRPATTNHRSPTTDASAAGGTGCTEAGGKHNAARERQRRCVC